MSGMMEQKHMSYFGYQIALGNHNLIDENKLNAIDFNTTLYLDLKVAKFYKGLWLHNFEHLDLNKEEHGFIKILV